MLILICAVLIGYVERTAIAHVIPYIRAESAYDPVTLGYILSAFGWGYVAGLPLSAFVISRLGHARTLGAIAVGWSLAAFWFCLAHNAAELTLARFALGFMEAPLFPLFVSWIRLNSAYETASFRISIVEAASYVGMAFSGPLTVTVANRWGWRLAYVVIGTLPLVVSIGALFLRGSSTDRIAETVSGKSTTHLTTIRGLPFIVCALGFLLYNFAKTFYSTWLPGILVESFHFNSASAAQVTFMQSIMAPIASIAVGWLSAWLLLKRFTVKTARLLPMAFGFGFGCFIAAAPFLQSQIGPIVILSFVGVISTSALIWSVPNDLSAEPGGVVYLAGYLNAIANIGTIVSPLAVGYLLGRPPGYVTVLALLGCASLTALVCFLIGYRALGSEGGHR